MSPIALALDIALLAMLALTLVFCWRLERKLTALRKGQDGVKAAAAELAITVAQAEQAVKGMKLTAQDAGRDLQRRIDDAKAQADRLGLGVGRVRAGVDVGEHRSHGRGW